VITSATITVTVDDVRSRVNFNIQGDEGRAKHIAEYVLSLVAADAKSYPGCDGVISIVLGQDPEVAEPAGHGPVDTEQ
jgi:hypothetical protein